MVREMIQKTLDYVDSNIKEDITAEELAEVAGYSVFHFYRLFQSAVGIPVMQYVLRRKLLYVIYEIGLERKKTKWFTSMVSKHIRASTELLSARSDILRRSTSGNIRQKDLIRLIFFRRNTSWSVIS